MTATAARKSRYSDAERAEFRAARAALVEGVKTFEPEGDRQEQAFERLTQRYSERNSLLIIMQKPITAGYVQAMSKWNEEGRKIRKGAKALYILAPAKDGQRADVEIEDETTGETVKLTASPSKKRFVWVRVFDKIDTEVAPEGWNARKPAATRKAPARQTATPALDDFLK
jgi:hypothetical protein